MPIFIAKSFRPCVFFFFFFWLGDCGAPPRLKSAALSKEDERKNYHPRGSTVRYVCRPGYERTELTPVITCLENSTWSESPEFCRGGCLFGHFSLSIERVALCEQTGVFCVKQLVHISAPACQF